MNKLMKMLTVAAIGCSLTAGSAYALLLPGKKKPAATKKTPKFKNSKVTKKSTGDLSGVRQPGVKRKKAIKGVDKTDGKMKTDLRQPTKKKLPEPKVIKPRPQRLKKQKPMDDDQN